MNLKFEYRYRDAGNSKLFNDVVFSNTTNGSIEMYERAIRSCLYRMEFFIAADVDIPPLKFEEYIEELDHDWPEFECITATNEEITDLRFRDIEDLIAEMIVAKPKWNF